MLPQHCHFYIVYIIGYDHRCYKHFTVSCTTRTGSCAYIQYASFQCSSCVCTDSTVTNASTIKTRSDSYWSSFNWNPLRNIPKQHLWRINVDIVLRKCFLFISIVNLHIVHHHDSRSFHISHILVRVSETHVLVHNTNMSILEMPRALLSFKQTLHFTNVNNAS